MILDMIREGGPGAYLAIALGMLGLLLGGVSLVSLLGKSRSTFALGIVTLIVAIAAAGAGMLGTVWGRTQTERALAFVDSAVDKERIMRAGYRESQSASWIGLFAAIVPLALGAAGAFGGSRLQQPKTRSQFGGDQMAASDSGASGQAAIAGIFTVIALVACAGTWVMSHTELPKLRYGFDEHDQDNWTLASALDDVSRDRKQACVRLEEALDRFWEASDRREWPRQMRRPIAPELSAWRSAADDCAKRMFDELDAGSGRHAITQSSLLESVLLQDEALHARVLSWRDTVREPPLPRERGVLALLDKAQDDDEPRVGTGSLPAEEIRKVIMKERQAVKACYEKEIAKDPKLEGKIVISFTIAPNGNVSDAIDASDEPFPSEKVTACVLSLFKRMKFPKPNGGGTVMVKYPFTFKAAD